LTLRLASIDIGSNSIKLVVVESSGDSFAVLAREKEVVRLGHDTLRDKHLSPEAIQRAAETIKRFRGIAEGRGASSVIAIATASVREADNAAEFIAEVESATGVRIEVLSGIEEARLIGLAAAHGCSEHGQSLLNVDIGGGSTELSLLDDSAPVKLFSVKLGAVGLTERFIQSDPVKPKELRALKEEVRRALERPARELHGAEWHHATGTSGTIIAIGEALRLRRAPASEEQGAQPAGNEIRLTRLTRFNERVAALDLAGRRGVPGISPQRAEIVVAGGQILEGVMRALDIARLRTCDLALREGVIIDRLRQLDAESRPPAPDVADTRLRGVYAVGRRFQFEEAHARQVAALAEKIFDGLATPYKLNRQHRTVLSAAALLHDIGYQIAHESHHKHTLYLIKNSELTGFSESERLLIANVARYHSRSLPKERHPEYAALNQPDRETVWRLGAILRIAEALDRSHEAHVRGLECVREKDDVHIRLSSTLSCENEVAAAEQRRDMFEQAFGCKLLLEVIAPHKRADDLRPHVSRATQSRKNGG
jgi:exopolyphosphatase/guanosine-5'-triphosphate,3'-diphosphate pyrophosphatase